MVWQVQAAAATLNFLQTYNQAKLSRTQGRVNHQLGDIDADALLSQARKRMNEGVREAAYEREKGDIAYSDAVAMMAASGGGVDPQMLARIQQRANMNSMSAIYDASTQASAIRHQAATTKMHAKYDQAMSGYQYRDQMMGAVATAAGQMPRPAYKSPSGPKFPKYQGMTSSASKLNTWRSR